MVTFSVPLVTDSGVRDVWIADDRYAIAATQFGIDVVDLYSMEVVSSGTFPDAPSCVAADETAHRKLYVGTTSSGVFSLPLNLIRIPNYNFSSDATQSFTTSTAPPISNNQINDLAAYNGRVLISTAGSIELITYDTLRSFRSLPPGSSACFLTTTGGAYWTVTNSGMEVNYSVFPTSGTGIIDVDFTYNGTSSVPQLLSPTVNDIFIAQTEPNIISLATSSGGLVIQESQGNEAASLTKTFSTPDVLNSTTLSLAATYVSRSAYFASSSQLQEFSLSVNTVTGTHTGSTGTGYQTLSSGVINVVRTTTLG